MRLPVSIKKILFATDFSDYSRKARDYVLLLARKLEASVEVMHVIEKIYYLERAEEDYEIKEWYRELEKDLQDKLDREIAFFREKQIPVQGKLVYGIPWEGLIRHAENRDMDLIVIGSHGIRTREGRVLLGTTSHKVALGSTVPVFIVRSDPEEGRDASNRESS